jgi:hypothetical protein
MSIRIIFGIPIPSPTPMATRLLLDNPAIVPSGCSEPGSGDEWTIVFVPMSPFEFVLIEVAVLATFVTIPT